MFKKWLWLLLFIPSMVISAQGTGDPGAERVDLSPQEFQEGFQEGGLLLDVRTPGEYEAAHIPGAELIPVQELSARAGEIDAYKNEPVYVYCRSGNRSRSASQILLDKGFTQVYNLDQGIGSWAGAGLPLE